MMDQLNKMFNSTRWQPPFKWLTNTVCLMIILFSAMTLSAPGGYDQLRLNASRNGINLDTDRVGGGGSGHKERHYTKETLVETSTGRLRGLRRNVFGKEVYVYYGVPFAKPPLGDLRFKKPVELTEPWEGILNAVNLPNSCYQESYNSFPGFIGEQMWNPNTNISEDCLYMNLWVPKMGLRSKPDRKLPILIWLYGGGYMGGTITLDIYNADILAAENNVIVATINYRTGAFGFLYLNHDEAPGNQGMYDQVVAMNWIKKNAPKFGGDPNAITLFGESAGGGSVSFHLLSPISRHLFDRGILQSGTLNAPWSYMEADVAKKMAHELMAECGCNGTTSVEEAVKCLREQTTETISTKQWNSYKSILAFPSAPTIDGVFLPRHPMEMLKDGDFKKTELLIGSNKNEGTYFILYDFMTYFNKDGKECLSRKKFLEIINAIFPDRSTLEKEAILFQYTNWDYLKDDCKNPDMVAEVVGDYFFICPTNAFAQAYSDHGLSVYYYFFTQRTSSNPWGQWMGVLHADEIEYVFGHPLNNSQAHTLEEQSLSRRIMLYFTRFAATGNPGGSEVDWPLYTRSEPNYYILNANEKGQGRGPRSHSCAFWNEFMPLIKPGTNSLPSECGKERWDINSPTSAALSSHHPANKSCHIIILLFSSLLTLGFVHRLSSLSSSAAGSQSNLIIFRVPD